MNPWPLNSAPAWLCPERLSPLQPLGSRPAFSAEQQRGLSPHHHQHLLLRRSLSKFLFLLPLFRPHHRPLLRLPHHPRQTTLALVVRRSARLQAPLVPLPAVFHPRASLPYLQCPPGLPVRSVSALRTHLHHPHLPLSVSNSSNRILATLRPPGA